MRAIVVLLLLTTAAMAGPRQDMLAGVARCNALTDERQFLNCVYGAAQPVRAELGLPPASVSQQRLVPSTMAASPTLPPSTHSGVSLFGDSLHMSAYSIDGRGLFTVTLSDGSVWKQNANDTNFAHFAGKASNYSVSVVTSDGGATRLDVRGEGGPYLVARVR